MGTSAHPTNSARSLRPNLLRSGVDGKVTCKPGRRYAVEKPPVTQPGSEQVLCPYSDPLIVDLTRLAQLTDRDSPGVRAFRPPTAPGPNLRPEQSPNTGR